MKNFTLTALLGAALVAAGVVLTNITRKEPSFNVYFGDKIDDDDGGDGDDEVSPTEPPSNEYSLADLQKSYTAPFEGYSQR